MTTQPIVEAAGLSHSYRWDGQRRPVVDGVSFSARGGELVLLLGPSGSGKTTLLMLLAGLITPGSGTVRLFGRALSSLTATELQRLRARSLGFVFQTFNLMASLRAGENVRLALQFGGVPSYEASLRARNLLEELGIQHLARRFPAELSHGEQQRVAVCRAFAMHPSLILADEPTAALESSQGLEIIRLLHRRAREAGACVIVASHDLRLRDYADRILGLNDGRLS
jgi:ABC-type lipoprotein export system ATPase subunit